MLFAGTRGFADKVPVEKIVAYERAMLSDLRSQGGEILGAIRDQREVKKETEEKLTRFLTDFTKRFSQD